MAIEVLYLHIPFCHAKCAYCDFDSRALCGAALDAAAEAYVGALLRRLDAFGARGALDAVRTVYIGGGTPTALGDRLPLLVHRVRRWVRARGAHLRGESRVVHGGPRARARPRRRDAHLARGAESRRRRASADRPHPYGRTKRAQRCAVPARRGLTSRSTSCAACRIRPRRAGGARLRGALALEAGPYFGLPAYARGGHAARAPRRARRAARARRGLPGAVHGGGAGGVPARRVPAL